MRCQNVHCPGRPRPAKTCRPSYVLKLFSRKDWEAPGISTKEGGHSFGLTTWPSLWTWDSESIFMDDLRVSLSVTCWSIRIIIHIILSWYKHIDLIWFDLICVLFRSRVQRFAFVLIRALNLSDAVMHRVTAPLLGPAGNPVHSVPVASSVLSNDASQSKKINKL